jgi:hypothetical protein
MCAQQNTFDDNKKREGMRLAALKRKALLAQAVKFGFYSPSSNNKKNTKGGSRKIRKGSRAKKMKLMKQIKNTLKLKKF